MLVTDDERLDDLLLDSLKIIQKPNGFCFSIDAVLISHFVQLQDTKTIIDLGTGSGIIPLLLSIRVKNSDITGLEIQSQYVDMAQRSVRFNNLESRIKIEQGDIREVNKLFERESFDLVISNPPYMLKGIGKENIREDKTIARHEVLCNLQDVIAAGSYLVKPKGSLALVHRPERLTEILNEFNRNGFKNIRLRLVHPNKVEMANLVLIEGRKKGGTKLTFQPPLFMYNTNGQYTQEILNYYGK